MWDVRAFVMSVLVVVWMHVEYEDEDRTLRVTIQQARFMQMGVTVEAKCKLESQKRFVADSFLTVHDIWTLYGCQCKRVSSLIRRRIRMESKGCSKESEATGIENIHKLSTPLDSSNLINLLRSRRLVLGHISPSFHPLLSLLKGPCLDTAW
jgi:hypothetical protein